jgi:dienelactone hydrolase
MNEQIFWLSSRGQKMAAVLHLPEISKPAPGVLILHGFTGTKVEPHRIFVKMARRLASEGIAALRIDFIGSGDSEGDFENMTISGEVADALNALNYLRDHRRVDSKRTGILGLSLGGAVAALCLPKAGDVKAVVLWAPVSDPRKFLPDEVPPHPIDRGGNLLGPEFFRELPSLKPLDAVQSYKGAALIIHGTQDTAVHHSNGEAYLANFHHANPKQLHLITGADHTFNKHEWETEVINLTAAWFGALKGKE